MKHYYDWNAHDLSPLTPRQPVRIQDEAIKKWLPGIVSCARPEPRSYKVETQSGSILCRKRRHLHPANTGQNVIRSKDEPAIAESDVPVVELSYDVPVSNKAPHTVVSSPIRDVGLTSGSPCAS